MPQALAAVGYWVGGLFFTAGASAATAYAIAGLVTATLTYATSSFLLSAAERALSKRGKTGETRGMEVSIVDTVADSRVLLGAVRVGGINAIPPYTNGTNGEELNQVLALALHEVDSFGDVYFDQDVIPSDTMNPVTSSASDGKVLSGKYANVAWIRRYTGSMTQTVDFILNLVFPAEWPSTARGRGVAYAAMSFSWGQGKIFQGVPSVTFHVHGAKVYDPRKDSTNGGSGAHRYATPSTWEWSCNPALCWAYYRISDVGYACDPATEIDWPTVITAADISESVVARSNLGQVSVYTTATGAVAGNLDGTTDLYKTGNNSSWTGNAGTNDGYTKGSLQFRCYNAGNIANGLHTSASFAPAAGSSYTFAYALAFQADISAVRIFESGGLQTTLSVVPTTNDIGEVAYDGTYVRYYFNGKLLRTTAVATAGQTLYPVCAPYYATRSYGAQWWVQKRYTCNGMLINSPEALRDNERKIIDAMFGRLTFVNGKWQCYAGAWTAPTFNIAKEDWLSIDNIQTVAPRDGGRWNQSRCFYVDPTRNWQRVECYPRRNSTYKASDGAELIDIEMEQPMCTDEWEAQRKSEFLLRSSRNGIKLIGSLPPRFQKIKTFETVTATFAELGWASKTFRVAGMTLNPDGSVKVALQEEQDTDWTDLTASEYSAPSTAVIPATNPTKPSAPQNYVIRSLAGTLYHDWDIPVVTPQNTRYQVIASLNSADASVGTIVWEGDADFTNVPTTNVNSLTWYWTRAVANSYYSAYYPNTFGTLAMPAPAPHALNYPIADPNFAMGYVVGSYWYNLASAPSAGTASAGFDLPAAGQGFYTGGGAAYWTAASASGTLFNLEPDRRSIPGDPNLTRGTFQVAPGQWLNLALAYKRSGTVTGSGGLSYLNLDVSATRNPPGDIAYFTNIISAWLRVDNLSDGVWNYFVTSAQIPTSAAWAKVVANLSSGLNGLTGGTIRFGRFDITIT